MDQMNLEDRYFAAWHTPGNINEHLPVLRLLAAQCDRVVELGTNQAVSTTALLAAQPRELITYDLNPSPEAEALRAVAGACRYDASIGDSRYVEAGPCDLLFIDTLHTRAQLEAELSWHSNNVKRWVAMHDTVTFGDRGEDGGLGLNHALREFLALHREWRIVAEWRNNNGLTVIQRQ